MSESNGHKKNGRPLLDIDPEQVEKLAQIGCTVEEAALIIGCSKDTLERRFAADIEKGRANMKSSLRRAQFKSALDGNATMQIWLGKQYLSQREPKVEVDVNQLNADIQRLMAELVAGSQTGITGEAGSVEGPVN